MKCLNTVWEIVYSTHSAWLAEQAGVSDSLHKCYTEYIDPILINDLACHRQNKELWLGMSSSE
jgi:hypothetical protein